MKNGVGGIAPVGAKRQPILTNLKNIETHFNEPRANEYKENRKVKKIKKLGELVERTVRDREVVPQNAGLPRPDI